MNKKIFLADLHEYSQMLLYHKQAIGIVQLEFYTSSVCRDYYPRRISPLGIEIFLFFSYSFMHIVGIKPTIYIIPSVECYVQAISDIYFTNQPIHLHTRRIQVETFPVTT